MATKPLPSQEVLRQLLDYDPETGVLRWKERGLEWFATKRAASTWNARFAGKPAFTAIDNNGYRNGHLLGMNCYAHRVIWKLVTGDEPIKIDHISGDQSDNGWGNLRSVIHVENMKNQKRHKSNTSGFVGVHFYRATGRWAAYIGSGVGRHNLGHFESFEDAVRARKAAEAEYAFHPNHGRIN